MSETTTVRPLPHAMPKGHKWQPMTGGPEASGVVQRKLPNEPEAQDAVQAAASMVLARAVPPGQAGHETGLVVGYVQSGKTLSFTTVAALARDNKYQLVIIVAGSSIQLSGQSRDRLRTDLGISPDRPRTWIAYHNPKRSDSGNIQRIFDEWRDSKLPESMRQTVMITVMKQHQNLRHLVDLLRSLNLAGLSALIIDDEADQASLNNEVPDNTQSTTYSRLLDLRAALPSHTFLQYTATPQAPLLINIADTLSPNFVEVLEPGPTYTGGLAFFIEHPELVSIIPAVDVPTSGNQLTGAPDSLLEALRIFILGVAAGLKIDNGAGNRSMLVHPSHGTAQHQEFHSWISDVFEEWRRVLREKDADPDKQELLEAFQKSHIELSATAADLPAFAELLPFLSSAFNRTSIEEVNRRRGRPVIIDWGQQYAWILVGGQAMDRGYTVEGLTVTYMPRGIGMGNADTVEQRARFFGYKKKYLGYCRVYLEAGTRDAFRDYVEHEEVMRAQLKKVAEKGISLNEWRRAFVLDPSLKPCRDSVIEFDYVRSLITSEWHSPSYVMSDAATMAANQSAVSEFVSSLAFKADAGSDQRTDIQRHLVCATASLRQTVERLITSYRVHDPIDSQKLFGVLLQLALALDGESDEACSIYQMSFKATRKRSVSADGKIANLYQGEAPVHPKALRGSVYPGDQAIHAGDSVSVQIHSLTLTREEAPIAENVPVLAIWIPQRLAKPWLVQRQPAQANA